jgi:hypothetical protein
MNQIIEILVAIGGAGLAFKLADQFLPKAVAWLTAKALALAPKAKPFLKAHLDEEKQILRDSEKAAEDKLDEFTKDA